MKKAHWFGIVAAFLIASCGGEAKKPDTKTDTKTETKTDTKTETPTETKTETPTEEKKEPTHEEMAFLMVNFSNALKEKPKNAEPAANWEVMLKDPAAGVMCADCHDAKEAEEFGKLVSDKRPEGLDKWTKDTNYMKQLMGNWVKTANTKANGKLKGELKCTTCHEKVPS